MRRRDRRHYGDAHQFAVAGFVLTYADATVTFVVLVAFAVAAAAISGYLHLLG